LSDTVELPAHQYDDADQQRDAATMGMWIFLATEVMFFGGMFTGYIVYRTEYSSAFGEASRHLDIVLGGMNTGVLLLSSLTMAMAVHSARDAKKWRLIGYLAATATLGLVFLGIKFWEYAEKFREHLVPGPDFAISGPDGRHAELFFSFYFAMTGFHALHMLIGIGLLVILMGMALAERFSSEYFMPVENVGLYWHFVDIVWVFLFPILYLVERH
jgi:cytochrome c oxidase subunit 3